jgi:hypothetical protein
MDGRSGVNALHTFAYDAFLVVKKLVLVEKEAQDSNFSVVILLLVDVYVGLDRPILGKENKGVDSLRDVVEHTVKHIDRNIPVDDAMIEVVKGGVKLINMGEDIAGQTVHCFFQTRKKKQSSTSQKINNDKNLAVHTMVALPYLCMKQ